MASKIPFVSQKIAFKWDFSVVSRICVVVSEILFIFKDLNAFTNENQLHKCSHWIIKNDQDLTTGYSTGFAPGYSTVLATVYSTGLATWYSTLIGTKYSTVFVTVYITGMQENKHISI